MRIVLFALCGLLAVGCGESAPAPAAGGSPPKSPNVAPKAGAKPGSPDRRAPFQPDYGKN